MRDLDVWYNLTVGSKPKKSAKKRATASPKAEVLKLEGE